MENQTETNQFTEELKYLILKQSKSKIFSQTREKWIKVFHVLTSFRTPESDYRKWRILQTSRELEKIYFYEKNDWKKSSKNIDIKSCDKNSSIKSQTCLNKVSSKDRRNLLKRWKMSKLEQVKRSFFYSFNHYYKHLFLEIWNLKENNREVFIFSDL